MVLFKVSIVLFFLQSMLHENKRVRAKIQPTFEQLAMLHVAKVISPHAYAFTHVNKGDRGLCTFKGFHID